MAPVRAEPRKDAEQVTQLLGGEPVEVLEERHDWTRIETVYRYPGWVRTKAVAGPAVDEAWPIAKSDDPLAGARAYLGAPYERGGMAASGIDCSGLIHMAFRSIGVVIPRDSWQQEAAGEEVAEGDLRPGDVLCYPDHVAFWLGRGRILHATGREGVQAVIEEAESPELASQRRSVRRFPRKAGSRASLEIG